MTLSAPATDTGRSGLAALLANPRQALIALDYDGTLAPIVARPEDAVPQPGAVEVLQTLARQVGRVALVTGRPADAAVQLGGLEQVEGLVVLGQYGAQTWSQGRLTEAPPVAGLEQARRELPPIVLAEGADLEDKRLSLAVHTRRAPDPDGALARLREPVEAVARRAGLEVHPGRLVLELRPPGHDKGAALQSLATEWSSVLFAGDDLGDLPAFDALERMRQSGIPVLMVCSASDEGPAALRQRADLVVPGPPGIVALLRGISEQL